MHTDTHTDTIPAPAAAAAWTAWMLPGELIRAALAGQVPGLDPVLADRLIQAGRTEGREEAETEGAGEAETRAEDLADSLEELEAGANEAIQRISALVSEREDLDRELSAELEEILLDLKTAKP